MIIKYTNAKECVIVFSNYAKAFGKVCHKEQAKVLNIFGRDYSLIQNLCDRIENEFSK